MRIRRRAARSLPRGLRAGTARTPNLIAAFDADWYARQLPAAASMADPLGHYLERGWRDGLDPSPLFASSWYAEHNPDAVAAGFSPLEHYVDHGWQEGRDPCPLFSTQWYLYQFPGRGGWQPDPMTHFRIDGWHMGVDPHPLFDVDWYLTQMAQADAHDLVGDPLSHYIHGGWRAGLDPNPIFASEWYIEQHPEILAEGRTPLEHYIVEGAVRGADPSPVFSTTGYVARHPHCGGRADALAHFLEFGRGEGITTMFSDSDRPRPHSVDAVDIIGTLPTGPSVAIVAMHDERGTIGPALQHFCRALAERGIGVVLSADHAVEAAAGDDDPWDAIIAAPHRGYDFFSWRLALEQFPPDAAFEELLILNDSIVGPFAPIDDLLRAWRALPFDVTGLLESSDPRAHLQSWALRFGARLARPTALLDFYGRAPDRVRKGDVIDFMEIPLADHFRTRGFSTGSLFSQSNVSTTYRNPAIFGWRELLSAGLPFVKREVLALGSATTEMRQVDVVQAIGGNRASTDVATVTALIDDALAQINRRPLGELRSE